MQTKLHLPDIHAYKGLRAPAKIVSYLFHPLFMPLVMAVVVSYLDKTGFAGLPAQQKNQLFGNIALNTIFFPLFSTLLMKALGFIDSVYMHTAKDRIIPLIATMAFYFWGYLIMKGLPFTPLLLKVLMLGSFWGVIVVFIANIFMKISMHTAAAGGALGLVIVLMMISHINLIFPLLLALLVGGIIGTARLVLQAHRPAEVWLGYFAGVLVQLAAYLYLR